MKKITLTLSILCALLALTTCQHLPSAIMQEPVVSLYSVDLTSININGVQLLCKVQIENPNGFDIPFPETDWELFINAYSFISGTIRNDERIRARSTTIVEIPVNLGYLDIFNSFASLIGNLQFDFKTAFAVKFSLPVLGERVLNLEYEGTIPLPQLPRITMPTKRVGNINATRAEIIVTMNVENPNMFPIPSPRIIYDFQLNRNSFIRGNVENDEPLAASATTPVNFLMVVTYADLFRSFASLLLAREATSLLVMTCDFNIPVLNIEPMRFEVAGTLPIMR
jgi:LEA14-like dessication related protein